MSAMARERLPVDKLIEPAIDRVAATQGYFHPSDVVRAVLQHGKLADALKDLRQQWGRFDEIVIRYIKTSVSSKLHTLKDTHGVRVYECYPAGEAERRWLRFRALTLNDLRAVIAANRKLERTIHVKGENYQAFYDELKLLTEQKPNAEVNDIYDRAIVHFHHN
jgi:hypothetical protein